MADTTLNQFVGRGTAADMAAFTPTPPTPANAPPLSGYIFFNTDDGVQYSWDGAAWVAPAGTGTVTNTGTLTDHAVIVGNGGVDVSALASLGTSGQVLTSNGAGADPSFQAASGTVSPFIATGRLTLESGVPVSTTDQLAKGTIYYTPYLGAQIALYDGAAWALSSFTERSLALTITSGMNYDVFLYNNTGTLTLELSAAWASDTTRTDAISLQDGIYVKTGATTRRLLGTIRASGANVTADSGGVAGTSATGATRYVWNYQNQVARSMSVIDTTNTWSYTTGTWRQANNASGNKVEWIQGLVGQPIDLRVMQLVNAFNNNTRAGRSGIGYDTTSGASGLLGNIYNANASVIKFICTSIYLAPAAQGYHFGAWMEYGGDGNMDWVGDDGGTAQCGMAGVVWC